MKNFNFLSIFLLANICFAQENSEINEFLTIFLQFQVMKFPPERYKIVLSFLEVLLELALSIEDQEMLEQLII